MCFTIRRSVPDVRITSMSKSENVSGDNRVWNKTTVIHNKTEDTIVLRDMHRYVWRQVRMELKPNESKRISVKAPSTFFRMGAILKVDETEKDLKVFIDTEQLVGKHEISICKQLQNGNPKYYVQ